MPKQKTLAELNAEKEKIEQQLTQEQHKKQRLENRIAYYERGDRTKRAHNLIVRSADMESICETVERKIGNTWYTVETVCDGNEPLTQKVKRLIFSDREVAC